MALLAAALAYLAIAFAYARTRAPYVDEAWFSLPAWNLESHGSFGTPLIEPVGSPLPGLNVKLTHIRSHTYWYLPLPIVVESAWFRVVGFSVLSMRLFSTLWAVVLLAAWYIVIERLSGSTAAAMLAVVLTAADPVFLERSGFGRFDLMSCGLGFAGLACYLVLRERSLSKALLASHALVAAAGMTHPTGGLLALPGLMGLIFYYDRHRLRRPHLLLVALPYLAAAAGMAIYILQDPQAFRDQFFGITGGRLGGMRNPLSLIAREIGRYLQVYGLNPEGSAISRLKLVILAIYGGAAAWLCSHKETRERYGGLLLLSAVYVGALTVFDDLKQQWYVVYIIPFFGAMLAAAVLELPARAQRWAAVGLTMVCLADVASVVRVTLSDGYDRMYRPMVSYLRSQAGGGGLVMATSEVGLEYGLDRNLVDDIRLGCRSGKTPALVIVETRYREAFEYFRTAEPATAHCVSEILQKAELVRQFGSEYTAYAVPVNGPGR